MSSRKPASDRTRGEPSREEKAAFVKAMLKGIEPGSAAAKKTEEKRAGLVKGKPAAKKSAAKKTAAKTTATSKTATKNTVAKKGGKAAKPATKKAAKPATTDAPPQVEILRKIVPSTPVTTSAKSASAIALAKEIEAALEKGDLDFIQPHAVQALFQALVKYYGANDENGNLYPIIPGRLAVTGTDAMVVCGALLRAVDLQVFELGMFQSWSGR